MKYNLNIVGAGFVGLTLAQVLTQQSSVESVTVIDVDKDRISNLTEGKIPVKEKGLTLKSKKLKFTTDYAEANGDVYFVCVGTPDNGDGTQNLSYLESAIKQIVANNKKATIVLKSTTLPENVTKLSNLIDPIFGHFITNPEFLAEGKAVEDMMNQPQLIIGSDEDTDYAREFLSKIFEHTYQNVSCVGLREAMVIKYFLNCYKAMKLNFINAFASYCGANDISYAQVLGAIRDPVMGEGFDKPGIGFGGSCFPKDTHAMGTNIPLCNLIYEINEINIINFANVLATTYAKGSKLLFGGKAFKNGTNDTRESVSVKVANLVSKLNPTIKVYFYDELPELSDLTLSEIRENKDKFDGVFIFNSVPELIKIFGEDNVYNTRKY